MTLWLQKGHYGVTSDAIWRRLYSDSVSVGLHRDLTVPFEPPAAKTPVTLRPLRDSDVPMLLDLHTPGLTSEAIKERLARLGMLQAGIRQCFVAAKADDSPCFMVWLIGSRENEKVQAYFDFNPILRSDELLIEYAFTLEQYRGQGIMACATAQLARKAQEFGGRRVIAFVRQGNAPSLRAFKRAGFVPYAVRIETRRLLRRRAIFTPVLDGAAYSSLTRCGISGSGLQGVG